MASAKKMVKHTFFDINNIYYCMFRLTTYWLVKSSPSKRTWFTIIQKELLLLKQNTEIFQYLSLETNSGADPAILKRGEVLERKETLATCDNLNYSINCYS